MKTIDSFCLAMLLLLISGLFQSVSAAYYPDSLDIEIVVSGKYAPSESFEIRVNEGRWLLAWKTVKLNEKGVVKFRIAHPRTEDAPLTFVGEYCFGHGGDKCNWAIRLTKNWKNKPVRLNFKYYHRNWLNEI
jgi:hypothetical protein